RPDPRGSTAEDRSTRPRDPRPRHTRAPEGLCFTAGARIFLLALDYAECVEQFFNIIEGRPFFIFQPGIVRGPAGRSKGDRVNDISRTEPGTTALPRWATKAAKLHSCKAMRPARKRCRSSDWD